jgi:hypothetical protein
VVTFGHGAVYGRAVKRRKEGGEEVWLARDVSGFCSA